MGKHFLDAAAVHNLLSIVYGPSSAATGIAIPDVAHLEAIRWQDGRGGERAANWMHLLTASVALFVVLPRLALVVLATLTVWRRSFATAPPPSLVPYFRKVFGGEGVLVRTTVAVIPYAYEPATTSLDQLRRLLTLALGENGSIDLRMPVRMATRDAARERRAQRGPGNRRDVVLLNLAADA